MLGKHYEVVHKAHTKLGLADFENAKEENLKRFKEAQNGHLAKKNKEREEQQRSENQKIKKVHPKTGSECATSAEFWSHTLLLWEHTSNKHCKKPGLKGEGLVDNHNDQLLMYKKCKPLIQKKTDEIKVLLLGNISDEKPLDFKKNHWPGVQQSQLCEKDHRVGTVHLRTCWKPLDWNRSLRKTENQLKANNWRSAHHWSRTVNR